MLRNYVDAGNDIITALDILTALKHGNGLHNAKASVVEINADKTNLESEKIPKWHMCSTQYSLGIHKCCCKRIITF